MTKTFLLLTLAGTACTTFLACVGDTSTNPQPTNDAQVPVDAPIQNDSALIDAGADTTPQNDAQSDASACIAAPVGMISMFTGDNVTTDTLGKNPLAWTGAPAYAAGKVNNGFQFANKAYIGTTTPKGLDNLAAFTIELWIQPFDAIGHTLVQRVANGTGWQIVRQTNGSYRFAIVVNNVSAFAYTQTSTFSTSTPTHLAFTFNSAPQATGIWYVNGVLDNTTKIFADGGTTTLGGTGNELRFGELYNGILDEISLYGRALADTEIKTIFDAGTNGKCR
jgi:Concanavalin A-like lectin/glucanases superfamily